MVRLTAMLCAGLVALAAAGCASDMKDDGMMKQDAMAKDGATMQDDSMKRDSMMKK